MRLSPRVAPPSPPVTRPLARARAIAGLAALLVTAACRTSGDGSAASAKTASAAATAPTSAGGETVPAGAPAGTATVPSDSTAIRAAADAGRILGSPDAKLWMLIASDFQCPYCKQWHDQTYDVIRREYVETGKLRIAFLNFPLDMHEQALPTAEAAMCASAQGKFWDYHTAIFNSQARWAKTGDQSAVYDSLAASQGLDGEKFAACTRSHVMRSLILADQDRMSTRGVQSTPSFFIGNQVIAGVAPAADFRRVIDAALAQSAR